MYHPQCNGQIESTNKILLNTNMRVPNSAPNIETPQLDFQHSESSTLTKRKVRLSVIINNWGE